MPAKDLTVTIRTPGRQLARLTLELLEELPDGTARYSVRVATDRGDALGFHQRSVLYNSSKWNPLALVKLALDSLDEESFEAEYDDPRPPDMAREERRTLREIQGR
jgi:hypothetical protein